MNQTVHNKIVNFIWSIADDCLRDVYVRGKYRDVILPMIILRRLDALLEPSKDAVLKEHEFLKANGLENDEQSLQKASGYVFYNTSEWTLKRLRDTASNKPQSLLTNFNEYLNGFSQNVREIIDKFNLRAQVERMSEKNVLLGVLEKFTSSDINLTDKKAFDSKGNALAPLSNLGMGYVFEELIRRFNEENNEEAGEHFTPREVIKLMTHLIFKPLGANIPTTMSIYDPACGSGGMLTEAQDFITDEKGEIKASESKIYLHGIEINDETYAICKSDMMIKGGNPENIKNASTLSSDVFGGHKFDFMLSNPPYGKSWESDARYIKDGKDIIDPRFSVGLKDFFDEVQTCPATPRENDGQLLFLMEMINKMKPKSQNNVGSRIASVHNGSALFTGDAGGGESNIRRYIIENDLLEAIIQLPNNLFYNTGITTYIWLLSNAKNARRKGKVQLIDASRAYSKLRKNLGKKNCALNEEHIAKITQIYEDFVESDGEIGAKIFDNADFGYYKINVLRPLRLKVALNRAVVEELRPAALALQDALESEYNDFNVFVKAAEPVLKPFKLTKKAKTALFDALSTRDQTAAPVVKKSQKSSAAVLSKLCERLKCEREDLPKWGYYEIGGEIVRYESDALQKESETIPLKENITDYFARETLPYAPDAWLDDNSVKIGYEIPFTRYFYRYESPRPSEQIKFEIRELEASLKGALDRIFDEN